MDRIEKTLDPNKPLVEEEKEMARVWAEAARTSPAPEVYEKSLAAQSSKTGCAAEGAPYVIRALLQRLDGYERSPLAKGSPEVPKLAAAFLDKNCAGAHGLSEDDIVNLKAIRDRAPPQAPKP